MRYGNVECFDRRGMQCICFTDDEFAYLAFRGSESLGDWLYNFATLPWFRPARHFGFEAGWRCLRRAVMLWLERLNRPEMPLILTGHSLGGAIAHLAALDLAGQKRKISNVITFGAPRAAFLSTAQKYNRTLANIGEQTLEALTFCVVNQRDLVPRVPPKLLGFRNVGRGVEIDQEDQLHVGVEIDSTLPDLLTDIIDVAPAPPANPLQWRISKPAIEPRNDSSHAAPSSNSAGLLRPRIPGRPQPLKRAERAGNWTSKDLLDTYLNVARAIPPLLLPVLYVRAVVQIGSSGANHLSDQYWRAFYGDTKPPKYLTGFSWSGLLKILLVLIVAVAVLAGFFWTCWVSFQALRK
jgi:pimeloyl-ACP methyl ester carboxylesterase